MPEQTAVASTISLPDYPIIALLLQGGGALGSYQAGVYQGLHEVGITPNWVAGISIGAINTALIAGGPPDQAVTRLNGFWEAICREPAGGPLFDAIEWWTQCSPWPIDARLLHGLVAASQALLLGQPGFFQPRPVPPWFVSGGGPAATSYYDTHALAATLEQFVDFDYLNNGNTRVSVGAVNVRTGNVVFFDTRHIRIDARHIMASGALPPAFPAVEIGGEFYWDGGIVSNTPLAHALLNDAPSEDTLAFQVDLWPARGPLPNDMLEVGERQKDIQFSSRTRAVTDQVAQLHALKAALCTALQHVPEAERNHPDLEPLKALTHVPATTLVQLIYQSRPYERHSKDYEFGMAGMREHWSAGLADMRATLTDPRCLDKPADGQGLVTHDVHRSQKRKANRTAAQQVAASNG